MRATSFFFTPSTDNVNGSTSSDDGLSEEADVPATKTANRSRTSPQHCGVEVDNDGLSEEAEVPATGMAVLTIRGGESKEGDTVVADMGMKESQSEEDDSSNLESFGNPDSPELPEGAEENLIYIYVCSFWPPL